jgi:hypothetical protein
MQVLNQHSHTSSNTLVLLDLSDCVLLTLTLSTIHICMLLFKMCYCSRGYSCHHYCMQDPHAAAAAAVSYTSRYRPDVSCHYCSSQTTKRKHDIARQDMKVLMLERTNTSSSYVPL